jgi:site-specific DNA recombinase
MEQKKRVGIWVRVSTEFQVKDDSPEHHEQRARYYAEAKGWEVVEVYRLEAVSGKTVMELPTTKKMLRDIQTGRIDALIFSKLARLARNTKELLEFSELFRKSNADMISLAENIDTSSPSGRLFFTIIAAMAEWERAEIADRVAASVPIRAKMGKPLGGAAPFGYQWKGKELVINEQEAPVRKLIYELFAEHKRKKFVVKMLNDLGHRTRNGSKFTDTTIGRLLHDSTAKGIRIANYTKSTGDGKKWVIKPESEWVHITCLAIVSEELWGECETILKQQEQKNKKVAKRAVHLLAGILHCECGGKMYVFSNIQKYKCSTCRQTKIATEDIEEIYYEHLKTFLCTDEHIDKFLSNADEAIANKELQLEKLKQDKKHLEAEMDKTMQLYLAGQIAKDNFSKYYTPLDVQVKQIEHSIPEVQGEIDFFKIEYMNSDMVMREARDLCDRWPTLVSESKRTIVERITDRITIGSDEIKIKFAYNPTYFQNPENWQRNFTDS